MTNTGVVIYYNTSDGEYFQDANQRLYKIVNGKKVVVDLSVNSSVFSDNPETLSNYRREQLILKLSYEALVKSRLVVQDLEKAKCIRTIIKKVKNYIGNSLKHGKKQRSSPSFMTTWLESEYLLWKLRKKAS